MKVLSIVCRILLGLAFVFFGGLGLFMHAQLPPRGSALGDFVNIFREVGWAQVISAFQVIGGLLVLFGGTVPFGLCILCPITVNIWLFHILFHILFHAFAPSMIVAPIVVTILEVVLLYAYRASFAGVWTTKATPTL